MQGLKLLHLLLEDPDVIHESHDSVRGHRGGVEARRGEQRGHMQRHGALGCVKHKQLAPRQPKKGHLVGDLQVGKERDVSRPLHGAEEQTSRQLADVLDAHQVVSLHALGPVARRGVGLGAQQQRNEAGQVGLAVVRVGAVGQVLSRAGLRVRCTSSLYS